MLNTEQKENLIKLKEMSDNVSSTLSKLINDEINKADASNELGILPQDFSRNVACNFVYYYRKPQLLSQATADEIQMMLESPYDKLFRDIFNITDAPGYLVDYETSEKLYDVMQQALDEREIRVIIAHYGLPVKDIDAKPQRFNKIAESEHFSSEYIRKVYFRALRKLRNPEYVNQLLLNADSYTKRIQEADELAQENDRLDNLIADLINSNANLQTQISSKMHLVQLLTDKNVGDEQIMQTLISKLFSMEPAKPDMPDDTDIRELDFSARATNALLRNNVCTLGDIKRKSLKDLYRMYALGARSVQEICYKLYAEYGIILPSKH